ncbi:MAG: AI-2E family transporter [Minicystis sp.]
MNDGAEAARDAGSWTGRRLFLWAGIAGALGLAYALRGVILPLFLAFLVAYALDPIVDRLDKWRVPRSVGAPLVMLTLVAAVLTTIFLGVPFAVSEFRHASENLPQELDSARTRIEELLWTRYHYRLPVTWSEMFSKYGGELRAQLPEASKIGSAILGSVGLIFVLLGTLIVPIFALYLLGDFDRIVKSAALLVPRRWAPGVSEIMREIHVTLGRYVRGQLLTNLILAVLYATGLSMTGVRLAIPIGVLTGMLAFIPYVGLIVGTVLAAVMALLDWQGPGQIAGVLAVMATVGVLDGMVITPRIVGGSVGLKPLEVILTMMAAGTLFGFLGVLLAVPIGAVVKILVQRAVTAYLASDFYARPAKAAGPDARESSQAAE